MDFKKELLKPEYDFLRENEHLGNNIILLGLGGSHAYGMSTVNSDLDCRGCALNNKKEILLGRDFEQVENRTTDTVVYSLKKLIKLLTSCNPNTIELLGLKPEHYLYLLKPGELLLENKKLFLSRRAIDSFGGYSLSQLRRLDNKAMRELGQVDKEQHILNSITNAKNSFPEKFFYFNEDQINLYLDDAIQEDFEKEIFMDINLRHYPLRDYKCMLSEMANIVKEYGKIGKRNKNAINRMKLSKHQAHLIRLYLMCFDILEKEEIITYRENDLELLMSIRNGDYLDSNYQPTSEFYELLNKLEKALIAQPK